MNWREKGSWAALCLVLIGFGLAVIGVWPVLVAHLTTSNWIMLAIIYPAVLFSLSGLYARVPKDTPARSEVLLAAVVMITNWSINLFLMGKIGGH